MSAIEPPDAVIADHPLDRLTTVRTGGSAEFFARPESERELVAQLDWAKRSGLDIGIVGSGSNLLVSDDGFCGLAIKLAGDLVAIEKHGDLLVCGGGTRLPSAAAKTASWGLTGLEFGINIPGTAGGAVRMNANAYGGRLADVIESVRLATSEGVNEVAPESLGFSYRESSLGPEQVVTSVSFRLSPGEPERIRERLAEMRAWRKDAQPSGIKTFGSTFKNPDDPRADGMSSGQLLDAAGCRGLTAGQARLSEKHANFVENMGGASTADVLAVMAAARRRVFEKFELVLEPEVQVLGDISWPDDWDLGTDEAVEPGNG